MSDQTDYSIQGGCLCGAVRFELTAAPMSAGYCHCTRCQRRTGTGFSASAFIDPASLRWLQGEDYQGLAPARERRREVFLRRLRRASFLAQPRRIARRHPDGRLRQRPGRSSQQSSVRRLCGQLGHDPRRRPAALRRGATALGARRLLSCRRQGDLSRQPAQERRQLGVTFGLPAVEQPRQRCSPSRDQPLRRLMPDLGDRP